MKEDLDWRTFSLIDWTRKIIQKKPSSLQVAGSIFILYYILIEFTNSIHYF